MKIKGMMARSVNFSAVSWDPSFVKTKEVQSSAIALLFSSLTENRAHTQTRGEQGDVEISDEFLGIRVKHALSGSEITR